MFPRPWRRLSPGLPAALALVLAFLALGVWHSTGNELQSYRFTTYGNTLIAAAAAVYVANAWFRAETVGRCGTWLAATGALGIGVSLVLRGAELYVLGQQGFRPSSFLYELMVVVTLVTVVAYLVLEAVYRTRLAGAVVLPAAVGGVLCEIWLVEHGVGHGAQWAPQIAAYWVDAQRLAQFLGCAVFALAAALALRHAWRQAERSADRAGHIHELVRSGVAAGFSVLLLAAVLSGVAAPELAARVGAAVMLASAAAGLFYARRAHVTHVVWLALGGFTATLLLATLSATGGVAYS